jgi:hypothetical protein
VASLGGDADAGDDDARRLHRAGGGLSIGKKRWYLSAAIITAL